MQEGNMQEETMQKGNMQEGTMQKSKPVLEILYIIFCLAITFIAVFHLYLRFGGNGIPFEKITISQVEMIRDTNDASYPYIITTYDEYKNYINNFKSSFEFNKDFKERFPKYSPEVFEDNAIMVYRYHTSSNKGIYAWRGYKYSDEYVIKYYERKTGSYDTYIDLSADSIYYFLQIPKVDIEGTNFITVQEASKPKIIDNVVEVINAILHGRAPEIIS